MSKSPQICSPGAWEASAAPTMPLFLVRTRRPPDSLTLPTAPELSTQCGVRSPSPKLSERFATQAARAGDDPSARAAIRIAMVQGLRLMAALLEGRAPRGAALPRSGRLLSQ